MDDELYSQDTKEEERDTREEPIRLSIDLNANEIANDLVRMAQQTIKIKLLPILIPLIAATTAIPIWLCSISEYDKATLIQTAWKPIPVFISILIIGLVIYANVIRQSNMHQAMTYRECKNILKKIDHTRQSMTKLRTYEYEKNDLLLKDILRIPEIRKFLQDDNEAAELLIAATDERLISLCLYTENACKWLAYSEDHQFMMEYLTEMTAKQKNNCMTPYLQITADKNCRMHLYIIKDYKKKKNQNFIVAFGHVSEENKA